MQRPTVDFISRKFRPKPKSDGRSRSRSEDLVVGFQWPRVHPARVVFHATALVAAGRHQIVYTWNVLHLPLPPSFSVLLSLRQAHSHSLHSPSFLSLSLSYSPSLSERNIVTELRKANQVRTEWTIHRNSFSRGVD